MNPITQPILGRKMSDDQRQTCLLAIKEALIEICDVAKMDLQIELAKQADKLSNSELLNISRGAVQHKRAARTLLVALGPERLEGQFNCESIRLEVKRIKRWLKNRW